MEVVKRDLKKWDRFPPGEVDSLADELQSYVKECRASGAIFLFQNFAFDHGINPKHLARLREKSEDFRNAHEMAKMYQEGCILENAITRKFDANFSKYVLSCNHGWKEPKEENVQAENVKTNFDKTAALFDMFKDKPHILEEILKNDNMSVLGQADRVSEQLEFTS